MFNHERFIVWTCEPGSERKGTTNLAVLTPDLSDAFDLAERVFLAAGYELSGPRGEYIDHPMRRGIPGTSVRSKSTKKEIADFLSGLNKRQGTWDFKSIGSIEFKDSQLKDVLFLTNQDRKIYFAS